MDHAEGDQRIDQPHYHETSEHPDQAVVSSVYHWFLLSTPRSIMYCDRINARTHHGIGIVLRHVQKAKRYRLDGTIAVPAYCLAIAAKAEHVGQPAKFTKEQLIAALKGADGDLTRAAVELLVSPSTVYRAMRRYGVSVQEKRRVVAA